MKKKNFLHSIITPKSAEPSPFHCTLSRILSSLTLSLSFSTTDSIKAPPTFSITVTAAPPPPSPSSSAAALYHHHRRSSSNGIGLPPLPYSRLRRFLLSPQQHAAGYCPTGATSSSPSSIAVKPQHKRNSSLVSFSD